MKVLFTSIFALFLATSAWATGELSAPATCDVTDLGVSSGTLNVDLVWEANRINTSWYTGYGDNTQITGNGVPTSCNYDSVISLPAAPSRPGYNFVGWTLKCFLPTLDSADTGTDYGYINGDSPEPYASNAQTYGLTQSQTWGATFLPGKMTGSAMCSAHAGNNHNYAWGGSSSDWTADTATLTGASGSATYCWCRVDAFTPTSGQWCDFSPQKWVFNHGFNSTADCSGMCAPECAQSLRSISEFRDAVYGAAAPLCRIPAAVAAQDMGTAMAAKSFLGDAYNNTYGGATPETYGLTQAGQWGVSWQTGDKVVGEAMCSASSSGTPVASTGNEAVNCWCKATGYISASNSQCSFSDSSWVLINNNGAEYCLQWCTYECANYVRTWEDIRVMILNGLFAQ